MKNLIVTFQGEYNFGAVLQAYALNHFLNQYESTDTLNYNLHDSEKIKKSFKENIYNILFYTRYSRFKKFLKNNIKLTNPVKNIEEIKRIFENYDTVICGSDQIWNNKITNNDSSIYLLDFNLNNNTKKISYAASFGVEEIDDDIYEQKVKKSLKEFDAISVREDTAKKILEKLDIHNSQVVLDPTFLIEKEQWKELLKDERALITGDYILVYSLGEDDRIKKAVEMIQNKENIKVIYIKTTIKGIFSSFKTFNFGPKEFINAFANSKYIITNSFHGLAFSLIFEKRFISVINTERGTRQMSLLRKLGLENCAFSNNMTTVPKINYKNVNEVLKKEKELSKDFLLGNVKIDK